MANYANLEAAIQAAIYENNTNDITGAALQTVLLQMVSDMGKSGMLCNGVCDGNTVPPVAPDSNIFYIAPTGTYANFGGLTVADGEWAIFIYNGGWQKQSIPVVTADAVPTTGSTNPVQSGGVADALDTKADIDGYYSTLTAGSAENLIGRGTVPAEYTRRTSGGSADIGSGAAAIEKIHGNTLAWNQLAEADSDSYTNIGLTISFSNGHFTISGTASSSDSFYLYPRFSSKNGHKYYVHCIGTHNFDALTWRNENLATMHNFVFPEIADVSIVAPRLTVTNAQSYAADFYYYVCDLTLMFGSGNEPTATEFEKLFPLNYYAYNTGSLLSLTGTGIETNGFNQWDEDWESGVYSNGGAKAPLAGYFRNVNPIPVFPSTTYGFTKPSGEARGFFYDVDGQFIRYAVLTNATTFTTNANEYYFNFYHIGATYNNDICINLSWSGYRNGEYEAYWDSTLALPITTVTSGGSAVFADGMKSCPVAYDEMTSTKAIKRCDKRAYTAGDESDSTVITDGTNTIYALTTPTEYTLDSEVNLNYRVDDFGTETLLPQNNATPTTAPIIYDVRYAMNAVDTLRNLPKNYISKDSMEHILNAMVTAGVISAYTLTWNATNENYDCTITA